jgi:hypothetical protein
MHYGIHSFLTYSYGCEGENTKAKRNLGENNAIIIRVS